MNYLIRIQLNGTPPSTVYDDAHVVMAKCGATRTIEGENGTYQLPHAEYRLESTWDYIQVRDMVAGLIKPIWADTEVLVSETYRQAWYLTLAA